MRISDMSLEGAVEYFRAMSKATIGQRRALCSQVSDWLEELQERRLMADAEDFFPETVDGMPGFLPKDRKFQGIEALGTAVELGEIEPGDDDAICSMVMQYTQTDGMDLQSAMIRAIDIYFAGADNLQEIKDLIWAPCTEEAPVLVEGEGESDDNTNGAG